MINVQEKAKDVLANLSDIQTQINLCGLTVELEKINRMKVDMRQLIEGLAETSEERSARLHPMRTDAVSCYLSLRKACLAQTSTLMTDEALQEVCLAAEMFVKRAGDYLDEKVRSMTEAEVQDGQKDEKGRMDRCIRKPYPR